MITLRLGAMWLAALLLNPSVARAGSPIDEPLYVRAVAQSNVGHNQEALALAERALSATAGPDHELAARATAKLVRAFALVHLRRANAAFDALGELAADGQQRGHASQVADLGPMGIVLRVRLADTMDRCEVAAQAAQNLGPDSIWASDVWAHVAQCFLRHPQSVGGHSVAATQARLHLFRLGHGVLTGDDRARALLLSGKLSLVAGDTPQAAVLFMEVQSTCADSPQAHTARQMLTSLRKKGLKLSFLPPKQAATDTWPWAQAHIDALNAGPLQRAHYRARLLATIHSHQGRLAAFQARLDLCELDLVAGRYAEALMALSALHLWGLPGNMAAHALMLQGEALAHIGDHKRGLKILSRAKDRYQNTDFAKLAALDAAFEAYRLHQVQKARCLCAWILKSSPVLSVLVWVRDDGAPIAMTAEDLHDNAAWLSAWILWRDHQSQERVDGALSLLSPTGAFAQAALYWRARSALRAHHPDDAQVLLESLKKDAPASYYALLGQTLLPEMQHRKPGTPSEATKSFNLALQDTTVPFPTCQAPDVAAAEVLWAHGLSCEARQILKQLPVAALSDKDRVMAAYVYRCLGESHRAVGLMGRCDVNCRRQHPSAMAISYPHPYAAWVQHAARRNHVPIALIYAIMHEESGFDKGAVSSRNAWGLMQILPQTAELMAQKSGTRFMGASSLLRPDINIGLGAKYLAVLLKQTHGNLVATVAAYQAGESNVFAWMHNRPNMAQDALAEDMPLASTRAYVRRVLSGYSAYQELLHEPPYANVHVAIGDMQSFSASKQMTLAKASTDRCNPSSKDRKSLCATHETSDRVRKSLN